MEVVYFTYTPEAHFSPFEEGNFVCATPRVNLLTEYHVIT
jgi:hypothetical protein